MPILTKNGQLLTSGGNILTADISGGGSNLQASKSYTVSASGSQTISPDNGYDGMEEVALSVPSQTLPTSAAASATSGYTSKATISRSTSDQYINIPTGYNSAGGYYKISAVANGSATGPSSLSGTSATVSTGTNTLTLTKTGITTTPTVSAGYVSSATASTATVALTASVTTKAAATYYPSTSDQTISASQYLTGAQTIKAVTTTNLIAANIKKNVVIEVGDINDSDRIISVTGSYEGSGSDSSKNIQAYLGYASRTANSYGATSVTLTVAKTGTYNISWCAWRGSSSSTMGTNLHIGSTTGTNQQTWTGTYGQCITLTNQSLTANTVLTLYATSGSNSRTVYVGNLIIEEQ